MKIAFGMIILNGNQVLQEAIESIYPYAYQILVAEGPVKYWQDKGVTTSTDGTNEILDNFPDPDNKIKIIHSQYHEKDQQCNAYIPFMKDDVDYLWNLDCDEVFKPNDVEKLISILESEKYTSVGFKSCTFYGGFDRIMGGFEENAEFIRVKKVYPGSYWATHRPPTIAHKVSPTLPEKHLDFNYLYNKHDIRMYHYSYTFPYQVHNKLKYYRDFVNTYNCVDNYFINVYLPWVIGDEKQKQNIEDKYNGVHEFKNREHARTRLFDGQHPDVILKNMDCLKDKFNQQLNDLRQLYGY
jgi:hypothetical protein